MDLKLDRSREFCHSYKIKFPYVTGSMYKGIAGEEMLTRLARSELMGFYGTGGVSTEIIENTIKSLKQKLDGKNFGMNLLFNIENPDIENELIDLYLKYGVNLVEASAYMSVSSALVRYRLRGIYKTSSGNIVIPNKIFAKISRLEVALQFLSPPPKRICEKLFYEGLISNEEFMLSQKIPLAASLIVESDSAGHTDQGVALTLIPKVDRLRRDFERKFNYDQRIFLGASGGIGTPESASAVFLLGADFIETGSINQCTVEAKTSNIVKDMLQQADIQDTTIVPAGDMLEMKAKVQVFKKGLLFPKKSWQLFYLYQNYSSIEEIESKILQDLESKIFYNSISNIYEKIESYYSENNPKKLIKAEKNSKYKMGLIFKWYFMFSNNVALKGNTKYQLDFQIHCGSSMGAFNTYVKGTHLENWTNRHVDDIANMIMKNIPCFSNYSFH